MLKKLIYFITILVCTTTYSQIGGKSVYRFLNLVTSPRQAALGGKVITIFDNDVNQALFNPATINPEMDNHLSLNYGSYFGEVAYGTAAYAYTYDRHLQTFHAGINYVNYRHPRGRTAPAPRTPGRGRRCGPGCAALAGTGRSSRRRAPGSQVATPIRPRCRSGRQSGGRDAAAMATAGTRPSAAAGPSNVVRAASRAHEAAKAPGPSGDHMLLGASDGPATAATAASAPPRMVRVTIRPMWPRGALRAGSAVAALVAGVGSAGAKVVVVVMTGSRSWRGRRRWWRRSLWVGCDGHGRGWRVRGRRACLGRRVQAMTVARAARPTATQSEPVIELTNAVAGERRRARRRRRRAGG